MVLPQDNNFSSCKLDEPSIIIHSTSHTNISAAANNENDFMLYPTLDYINRFLLEEDIDEQFITGYQEAVALSDIEKPFYDVLGEKYPPSPSPSKYHQLSLPLSPSVSTDLSSSISSHLTQDSKIETLMAEGFKRGVEEGMKFLPTINNLAIDFHVSRLSLDTTHKNNNNSLETKLGEDDACDLLDRGKAAKSSSNTQMDLLEGRSSKMPVLSTDETIRDEMFDKILLYHGEEYAGEEVSRLREIMKSSTNHYNRKNKENQEDNIDLSTLLIQCSEAVALHNSKVVEELLNEIRTYASPVGNGAQRLACILADGLEARLAGTGSETYRRLVCRQISTREILKAYHMYITASPFLRISYSFANDYICKVAENASKIHIIDLGITFGFQWPPLIQALSKKRGGGLELRITGVDLPEPGFRPTERIRQIGARLEEYAKSFGVSFKYQYIASPWDSICIDDLKIDEDEVLVINSMFRFKQVRDDTSPTDSPRTKVLNFIRQMKPKVFILGTFNVSFSPFFTMRFRKVLLQYSMLFDMFDELVPRNDEGRQLMERELLAPPIINLVACEGHDWVERPETYKQWHKRISRAGFEQMPIDRDIVKDCDEKVKSGYHEGFFMEEESGWLLQGWRGRINYALSLWEPKLH